MNKEQKINSNPESKKIEPELITKNNEVELNTNLNLWVPQFRSS